MKQALGLILILLLFQLPAMAQGEAGSYLSVVVKFTEDRQHLEAIKVCNKLEKKMPENPDVFFLRGINYYLLKEYEKAILDFDKTIGLKPDYPDAFLYRAKARKASKDYLGAFRDYRKAKDENFSQTVTSLAGDVIRSVFSND